VSPISHGLSNPSVFFGQNSNQQQHGFKVPHHLQVEGQVLQQAHNDQQAHLVAAVANSSNLNNPPSISNQSLKAGHQLQQQASDGGDQNQNNNVAILSQYGGNGTNGTNGTPQKSLADSKRSGAQSNAAQTPLQNVSTKAIHGAQWPQ